MPSSKPKPSEIAVEAKRRYFPYIAQHCPAMQPYSIVHPGTSCAKQASSPFPRNRKLLHDVIDGDPIDVALDWHEVRKNSTGLDAPMDDSESLLPEIPVINMANERRPGGDWESGMMAPEENMCRRSNLVQCLSSSCMDSQLGRAGFCMPPKGGVYSPQVVVFRSGPDRAYAPWHKFKSLPIISVASMRRPKLDASGQDYSFAQEKELMKEKVRTALRIAMEWGHRDLCVGAFGAGPGFRNPALQLARMWKDVLYSEPEFEGFFSSVVFAIEKTTYGSSLESVYDVFKQEFDPSSVYRTSYR